MQAVHRSTTKRATERTLMLNGKLVVGYVGSLVKYEGLDYLLEAIAMLPPMLRNNWPFSSLATAPCVPN